MSDERQGRPPRDGGSRDGGSRDGGSRDGGPRRGGRPGGFRPGRRKVCEFTALGINPDYKDIERIRRYIAPSGKILPRRRTGTSAKMQRRLMVAIKRARHMALLPYVVEGPRR